MAVPVIESSTETTTRSSIGITLTKPSGVSSGDLLLLIVCNGFAPAYPTFVAREDAEPATDGFFRAHSVYSSVSDCQVAVYWKIADGTEPSTTDVLTDPSAAIDIIGWYVRVSGADQNWPITVHDAGEAVNATSDIYPAITTEYNDCLGFTVWAHSTQNGDPFTVSGTGWTKQDDASGSTDCSGGYATKSVSTAGSTGDCTVTANSDSGLSGFQFAVNPTGSTSSIPELKSYTANTTNGSTASSITLTKPSGVATDDCLIIVVGSDDSGAGDEFSTPTGFTKINESGNSSSDCHVGAFYKIADGTEGSTINVTAASSDEMWGFYFRLDGVDTTTPLDQTGADNNTGSGTTLDVTGVTTTNDNSLAFLVWAFDGADGDPFCVEEDDWLSILDIQSGLGISDASGGLALRSMKSAGATGTATVRVSSTDGITGFQFNLNGSTGPTTHTGEVDFDSVSTLALSANVTRTTSVDFDSASTLTLSGFKIISGSVGFDGTSTLALTAEKFKGGTIDLDSTSTLTLSANVIRTTGVGFDSISTLTLTPTVTRTAAISLAHASTLGLSAFKVKSGAISLTSTSTLALSGSVVGALLGSVYYNSTHTITLSPTVTRTRTITLANQHELTLTANIIPGVEEVAGGGGWLSKQQIARLKKLANRRLEGIKVKRRIREARIQEISEIFDRVTGNLPPTVEAEVIEIIDPFVEPEQKTRDILPPVEAIDFRGLLRDVQATKQLANIFIESQTIRRRLEEEDEAMMLLLLSA